jgi:hypothetical protein
MSWKTILGAAIGIFYIYGVGVLIHEMRIAPEMYFDEDGYFRKKEWFIENNKTDQMYYDENCTERCLVYCSQAENDTNN